MQVHVPAHTSRTFFVPEYEVAPIVSLWTPYCLAGMKIEVSDMATTVEVPEDSLEDEYARINERYHTPEGVGMADHTFGGIAQFRAHGLSLMVKKPGAVNRLIAGEKPEVVLGIPADPKAAPKAPEPVKEPEAERDEIEMLRMNKLIKNALREGGFTNALDIVDTPRDVLISLKYITESNVDALIEDAKRVLGE
jgi:hypothetical protein